MKPFKRYGKSPISPENLARIRAKAQADEDEGYDYSNAVTPGERAARVPDGWNQNNG